MTVTEGRRVNSDTSSGERRAEFLLLAIFLLGGCENWPPKHVEASDYFLDHESAFESLHDSFLESGLYQVAATVGGVEAQQTENSAPQYLSDAEAVPLVSFLRGSGVSRVWRMDEEARFEVPGLQFSTNNHIYWAFYVKTLAQEPVLKACREEFRAIDCASCRMHIIGNWWLYYIWSPDSRSRPGQKPGEEMTLSEQLERSEIEIDRCIVEGKAEMEAYD